MTGEKNARASDGVLVVAVEEHVAEQLTEHLGLGAFWTDGRLDVDEGAADDDVRVRAADGPAAGECWTGHDRAGGPQLLPGPGACAAGEHRDDIGDRGGRDGGEESFAAAGACRDEPLQDAAGPQPLGPVHLFEPAAEQQRPAQLVLDVRFEDQIGLLVRGRGGYELGELGECCGARGADGAPAGAAGRVGLREHRDHLASEPDGQRVVVGEREVVDEEGLDGGPGWAGPGDAGCGVRVEGESEPGVDRVPEGAPGDGAGVGGPGGARCRCGR